MDFLNEQTCDLGLATEKDVSVVMRQCIKAVLGCHAHGFVHRDVKLDNFMVFGADSTVIMIDFGLASRASTDIAQVGTLDYWSPGFVYRELQRSQHFHVEDLGPNANLDLDSALPRELPVQFDIFGFAGRPWH